MTRPRVRTAIKKAVKKNAAKEISAKPAGRMASDGLEGVSFYLGRAYYRYIALVESALQEAGLSDRVRPGMGHVLFALFEKDDRVIKEIVERADVSPSTLTGILMQMEKHGLVVRRADKEDGRAVRVRLTPLAKSLERRLRAIQVRVHKVMYADLTAPELRAVKQGLARMTSAMCEHEARQELRTRSRAR
jgi:MarR family transcriptional regulator, organic hydroperoxide resistance regulator